MFIKTGDKVRVISGKDKGKEGTVTKTIASKDRVIVEGVNKVKKHTKASSTNPNVELLMLKHQSTFQMSCLLIHLPTSQLVLELRLKMARRFVTQRNRKKRLINSN